MSLQGANIIDQDNQLSEQEIQFLQAHCNEFRDNHNLSLFIYLYSNESDKPSPSLEKNGFKDVVIVYVNRTDTSVTVNTFNLVDQRKRFFEQVFFQFLAVPMKEGEWIATSITNTFSEIEKELIRRQQVLEQRRIEEDQYDNFDPRAVTMLWLFFWIIIFFGIYFLVRKARIKNKHEARSFYGISRLSSWLTSAIGLILLIGGSYLIMGVIANGNEMVRLVFWIAFVPNMAFLTYLITIVIDLFSLNEFNSEDTKPTLGQMLWLVRPSANTEHLMEITFYEQVIRHKINLEIETEEQHRRQVHHFYISPGKKFKADEQFRLDEAPFFEELLEENEILKPYLHRIYKLHGSFLVYRKETVMRALFRSGNLTKLGYLLNAPLLTPKGKALREKLWKAEKTQNQLIVTGIRYPANIPGILPKLTPHVLLIDDFERKLTHFYNVLVDNGLLDQAIALPIGFLFHPDFSLRAFNVNLMSAYTSVVVRERPDDSDSWVVDF